MANEIIDLGNWTCPRGWHELTLKQFQDIERYYSDKEKQFDVRDVLNIIFNKTIDEINALPISLTERLLNELTWMATQPDYGEPTNELVIDGEKYIVNVKEKLKTGEFITVDTVIKGDEHNYAAILAILCRKEGEAYDARFENEILPSRVEMFEKQPMIETMRVITFFLQLCMILKTTTQLYSTAEEAVSHVAKSIETSRKNGDLSLWSTLLLKRKLKKLRKSIPHI